jgi:hypothetical protein
MTLQSKVRVVRAMVFLGITILFAGCAELGIGSSARLTPSEKMMWSTYAIGTRQGMATCVIINRKDRSAPGGILPVLVTATHVLAGAPRGPYFLAIRTPNPSGNPEVAILEIKSAWFAQAVSMRHPRHDIAALELRMPPEVAEAVHLPSFIDENAIARPGDDARAGDTVSVLGFPKVFPGTEGGFAVLRAGKIASYSPGTPRDREKFLVNTNAYSGDSGGPVFAGRRRDGRPILLGLLIERIGEKAGEVPLAVAVDAHVIRETLQLLAQHKSSAIEHNSAQSEFGSDGRQRSTLRLKAPPNMFMQVVHAKKPPTLPLPVVPHD